LRRGTRRCAYHGNTYMPLRSSTNKSHRSALFTWLMGSEFEATSEDRSVLPRWSSSGPGDTGAGSGSIRQCPCGATEEREGPSTSTHCPGDVEKKTLLANAGRDVARRAPGSVRVSYMAAEDCALATIAVEDRMTTPTWHQPDDDMGAVRAARRGSLRTGRIQTDAKTLVAFFTRQLTKTARNRRQGYRRTPDLRLEGRGHRRCSGAKGAAGAGAIELEGAGWNGCRPQH